MVYFYSGCVFIFVLFVSSFAPAITMRKAGYKSNIYVEL